MSAAYNKCHKSKATWQKPFMKPDQPKPDKWVYGCGKKRGGWFAKPCKHYKGK